MGRLITKINDFLLTYYYSYSTIDTYSIKDNPKIKNKMSNNTLIYVTFRKEGVHCYPAALTSPELQDVSFLGHSHRHIFHFKVWIEVHHDDRDIEFIQFKRWLESLYDNQTLYLNNKSCEMIARDLHESINTRYPGREIWIDVSEDGENGCFIKFQSTL